LVHCKNKKLRNDISGDTYDAEDENNVKTQKKRVEKLENYKRVEKLESCKGPSIKGVRTKSRKIDLLPFVRADTP